MPILWRYVLKNFLSTFFLCIISLILILLITKVQEIAYLVSLYFPWHTIAIFILYQIPYMLPIAISTSGLIASILLCYKLSENHGITTFCTCGVSIKTLITPILLTLSLLTIIHFIITAEVTPRCRLYTHNLIHKTITINPLIFMKRAGGATHGKCYIDMQMVRPRKEAKDLIIAVKNHFNNRLNLMIAKQCTVENQLMIGENVTFISNIAQNNPNLYDHLIIENQETMTASVTALASFMQQPTYSHNVKHLPLRNIFSIFADPMRTFNNIKEAKCELCHRFFPPCITFSSIFSGLFLGIYIGKSGKKTGIYWTIFLSLCTLLCMLITKSVQFSFYTVLLLYLFPIAIPVSISCWLYKKIAKGIV